MGETVFLLLGSFVFLIVMLVAQALTYEDYALAGIGILIFWTIFMNVFIESIRIIIGR